MTKPKARLLTAYVWDCDECGAENFARSVVAELTDDDREDAYRKFHELEAWDELPVGWQDFQIVTIPDEVTCRQCCETFSTEND